MPSSASTNSAGKTVLQFLAEGFAAADRVHGFHLRVPALDAVFEIEGEDADIDGFDDVLVEFLQAFELADLFFQACVEAGVLQRDADVAGQRLEQFNVFAGKEVAADGAAEADDGDGARRGAVLHAARQVVVQIEQRGGRAAVRVADAGPAARFRERCASDQRRWSKSRKLKSSALLSLRIRCARRPRASHVRRPGASGSGSVGDEDGDARDEQRARQTLDDGFEQRVADRFQNSGRGRIRPGPCGSRSAARSKARSTQP